MAEMRGYEIPTIDCALITISAESLGDDELILDTASQIAVTPQIDTQDAITLIVKGILRSQKPQQNTLTGNSIVLTDNVFNPQLVTILQGGTITVDPASGRLMAYEPPVNGAPRNQQGEVFTLNCYTAIYSPAGVITGYEKIMYPNCQGVPIALSAQDDVFRVSEYTINSAPGMGEPPYTIQWLLPDEIPTLPNQPENPFPSPDDVSSALRSLTISGITLVPEFDQGVTSYTGVTNSPSHTLAFSTVATNASTMVRLNNAVVSGTMLLFTEGVNTLTLEVTNSIPEIPDVTLYTVTIEYQAPTANLTMLAIQDAPLTPAFDADTITYTANAGTLNSTITATPADGNATVVRTVNGTTVTGAFDWQAGPNTVEVAVTNGNLSKTYTVTVTYEQSAEPTIDAVADAATGCTGTGVDEATITVTWPGGGDPITTTVASSVWSIAGQEAVETGDVITATQTEVDKAVSEPATITVS